MTNHVILGIGNLSPASNIESPNGESSFHVESKVTNENILIKIGYQHVFTVRKSSKLFEKGKTSYDSY